MPFLGKKYFFDVTIFTLGYFFLFDKSEVLSFRAEWDWLVMRYFSPFSRLFRFVMISINCHWTWEFVKHFSQNPSESPIYIVQRKQSLWQPLRCNSSKRQCRVKPLSKLLAETITGYWWNTRVILHSMTQFSWSESSSILINIKKSKSFFITHIVIEWAQNEMSSQSNLLLLLENHPIHFLMLTDRTPN